MRRAARIDNNQREIVDLVHKMGYSTLLLHAVGKGCPDLLIGKGNRNYLIEIKSTIKKTLTDDQVEFFREWKGQAIVIRSVDEFIEFDRDK